jgi:hypothetical protein
MSNTRREFLELILSPEGRFGHLVDAAQDDTQRIIEDELQGRRTTFAPPRGMSQLNTMEILTLLQTIAAFGSIGVTIWLGWEQGRRQTTSKSDLQQAIVAQAASAGLHLEQVQKLSQPDRDHICEEIMKVNPAAPGPQNQNAHEASPQRQTNSGPA